MTLRARSTVIAALLTTVVVVLGWLGLLAVLQRLENSEVHDHVTSLARQNAAIAREYSAPTLVTTDDSEVVQLVIGGRVADTAPESADRRPLTTARPALGDPNWDGTVTWNGQRMITVGYAVPGGMVYAGQPEPGLFFDPPRAALIGAAGLACVGLVSLATWLTMSRALASIEGIRTELREITATDLGRRVPEPRHPEEFRRLAETVNATLERLEEAVGRQRRFAADASHELRSPVTALRTQLDLAMSDPEPDTDATLEGLDRAIDRLQLLVDDLLAVIRLDATAPAGHERIDLGELVRTELDRRPDEITRDLAMGALVEGDRLQLARVLTNLVDNALRHAEHEVQVKVRPDADSGHAVLEVIDDGGGIPEADRERVFQRFVRLKEGRERDASGSGLGLPIAREIAEGHGGSLNIADCEHGARFVLRLPLLAETSGPTEEPRGGAGVWTEERSRGAAE
ncbi:sensor histidine kinase [Streptosporangium sandarakinum]|uniref:sensor histidine kinase n=1 Tax=Streptosporangium sandarakinum TaxID=1260955 RepID=UPI0034338B67